MFVIMSFVKQTNLILALLIEIKNPATTSGGLQAGSNNNSSGKNSSDRKIEVLQAESIIDAFTWLFNTVSIVIKSSQDAANQALQAKSLHQDQSADFLSDLLPL